jgi:hypothetical protein
VVVLNTVLSAAALARDAVPGEKLRLFADDTFRTVNNNMHLPVSAKLV